jgi:hypothetical protein
VKEWDTNVFFPAAEHCPPRETGEGLRSGGGAFIDGSAAEARALEGRG